MPNLNPWINQNKVTNKFENHLLPLRDDHQNQKKPNLHHPTFNERHKKIIEMIDWTLGKYKETTAATNIIQNNQQNEEAIIIDNIIEELDKKRDIAINKKKLYYEMKCLFID